MLTIPGGPHGPPGNDNQYITLVKMQYCLT